MSRPAMSRHLRVLRLHGLVEVEPTWNVAGARLRVYRLRPEPFADLQSWLQEVQSFWAEQLNAYKAHVERTQKGTQP